MIALLNEDMRENMLPYMLKELSMME